ncbi:MAG TPA: metallopeptidase TldD-related protein [Micromonosporaceae bacterium]|nr:metallopeptidase TldD-related protein [Micromonosporaceae bacterium]
MSTGGSGMTAADIAAQVLDLVRAGARAPAQAEVVVATTHQALTRFANSFIHQNVADTETTVRLRVHVDGRTAGGATTLADAAGLRGLVERTLAAAALCPPDPGWPGLAGPAPLAGAAEVDETVLAATPADRAERVRSFVDAAKGLETAGYCRTVHKSATFANSAGQAVTGATTEAALDGIARAGGADGVARLAATGLAPIDGAVLGARAAAKARAGVDPVELPPGRYEVVLEATAVADVLRNLAFWGFNGKTYVQRRSFAVLDAAQFDPAVTLVDDPVGDGAFGLPFDAEGTPKRRLVLVDAGVTRVVPHDRRTAAEAGTASTGHALPDGETWGPVPVNLRLLPGLPAGSAAASHPTEVDGPAADSDVAALLANVERGLLVTDLWYTRVLDPKTLVVTGLTRNGVWLVEDGAVTRPVRNFRFTQSYPQALGAGAVRGIGRFPVPMPGSWGGERFVPPALHLASWNFTGGASG